MQMYTPCSWLCQECGGPVLPPLITFSASELSSSTRSPAFWSCAKCEAETPNAVMLEKENILDRYLDTAPPEVQ
jgi:hypothetical protein